MEKNTTDRISQLPEFILHNVLSFLKSPAELVRVSVLSKNWFAVTASFPIMDFDMRKFDQVIKSLPRDVDGSIKDVGEMYFKYVSYTTSRFCEQQNVSADTLILVTSLYDPEEEDIINRCLGLILMKGVKVLAIDINCWFYVVPSPKMYRVPNIVLSASSLKSLTIYKCALPSSLMVDVVKFNSLKVLELEEVPLNEEVIKSFTTSCPLLEELNVKFCSGFKRFSVNGLQNLQKVRFYFLGEVEKIDIEASNMWYIFLLDIERVAPCMNLASCKKLTTLSYFGYPSVTSNDLTDFLSNFPILETLGLGIHNEYNKLKFSSLTLKTFMINPECDLEEIDINTPKLLLFSCNSDLCDAGRLVKNPSLSKARMECDLNVVDAVWFKKLRRFLDKKIRFKELKLCINTFSDLIDNVEELNVIQSAPYELEHVELIPRSIEEVPVYIAVVEAILWCCRPQILTLSNFPCTNFEGWNHTVKFTYEKLLQQEDEDITDIQIVLSSSSEAIKCFSDLSSLLKASPSHRQGGTVTFIKQRVVQDERDDQIVKKLVNLEIS